jgi:RHS repeat-associated protein
VLKDHSSSADAVLMNGLGLDQVFTRTVGSTTRSVLADALGSTIALADDRGAITDQFAYGPFGESDTTVDHPFQYTGRENDGTGLYQFRNRYYSPTMKRFISEDPTGMAGSGTNYYAYANNDPLDNTDPTGLLSLGGALSSVSQFTAGAWDGATFGMASRLFGVDPNCWTGSAHGVEASVPRVRAQLPVSLPVLSWALPLAAVCSLARSLAARSVAAIPPPASGAAGRRSLRVRWLAHRAAWPAERSLRSARARAQLLQRLEAGP